MPNLGDRVKDRVNGFQGIVIERTERLFGGEFVTVDPEGLNDDGMPMQEYSLPVDRCEVLDRGAVKRGNEIATVRALPAVNENAYEVIET